MSGFDPGRRVGNSETWHRLTPRPTHSSATGSLSLKPLTGSASRRAGSSSCSATASCWLSSGRTARWSVPAAFFDGGQILKGLHGTLTVLLDCGFDDDEALRWLFTADDTLPGTPIQAMTERRGTEVNRRAQALAF